MIFMRRNPQIHSLLSAFSLSLPLFLLVLQKSSEFPFYFVIGVEESKDSSKWRARKYAVVLDTIFANTHFSDDSFFIISETRNRCKFEGKTRTVVFVFCGNFLLFSGNVRSFPQIFLLQGVGSLLVQGPSKDHIME